MGFHFRGWFGAWMAGEGAPRRAELGSHGNGGWGALGARRGPAWAFIGAWVSLGAGFLRLGGNAGLGECRTGAARTGGSGGRPWRRGNTGRVGRVATSASDRGAWFRQYRGRSRVVWVGLRRVGRPGGFAGVRRCP